MRKISVFLLFVAIIFSINGCASVPKESVTLSQEIGKGIINAKDGYVKLVDQKFLGARKSIHDDRDKAINKYIEDFVAGFEKKGEKFILDQQTIPLIIEGIDEINESHEAYLDALEKTRLEIVSKINANYKGMLEANATITGLLQSAVDVDEAAKNGLNTIIEASGSDVDLNSIFSKIDDWIIEAGKDAGEISAAIEKGEVLYNGVKVILSKEDE